MLTSTATREAIRAWHSDAEAAVSASEGLLLAAAQAWKVTDLRALSGGAMSVICSGTRDEVRVVIKAPVIAPEALVEASALTYFAPRGCVPRVLETSHGVLMMNFVEGSALAPSDALSVARALRELHGDSPRAVAPVAPTWLERREVLFDEYVRRLQKWGSEFDDVIAAAQEFLPSLLNADGRLLHGDLQAKNILLSLAGLVVLDPMATCAPLGWEVALGACSVTAAGGDALPIWQAGTSLGVGCEELHRWLHVAAVATAGTSAHVGDPRVGRRLRSLLRIQRKQ